MENKLDIKDFKEAVIFVLALGKSVKKQVDEKKFDINQIIALYPKAQAAIVGYENIIPQLKDIDANEAQELIVLLGSEIGEIAHAPKLAEQFNAGLKFLKAGIEFYKTF